MLSHQRKGIVYFASGRSHVGKFQCLVIHNIYKADPEMPLVDRSCPRPRVIRLPPLTLPHEILARLVVGAGVRNLAVVHLIISCAAYHYVGSISGVLICCGRVGRWHLVLIDRPVPFVVVNMARKIDIDLIVVEQLLDRGLELLVDAIPLVHGMVTGHNYPWLLTPVFLGLC